MEGSSTPLADYFWIAGVESVQYDDAFASSSSIGTPQSLKESQVESTIAEDGEPADDNANTSASNGQTIRGAARHSRQSSQNRLSKLSFDNRFSLSTLDDLESSGNTASNRSSATIRPVNHLGAPNGLAIEGNGPSSGGGLLGGGIMGDFDFDQALLKFASEREDFLDDLTFSAGAKVHSRPPMVNPRAERIRADDENSGRRSPLRSIQGSIRRRISFRDMNSVKRQPSSARPGGPSRTGLFPSHLSLKSKTLLISSSKLPSVPPNDSATTTPSFHLPSLSTPTPKCIPLRGASSRCSSTATHQRMRPTSWPVEEDFPITCRCSLSPTISRLSPPMTDPGQHGMALP